MRVLADHVLQQTRHQLNGVKMSIREREVGDLILEVIEILSISSPGAFLFFLIHSMNLLRVASWLARFVIRLSLPPIVRRCTRPCARNFYIY